jgi:hypothetical protein
MPRIDHPIEVAASPASDELDAHVERVGHAPESSDRELLDPAMFDPRNASPRSSGRLCEIQLAPASWIRTARNRRPTSISSTVRS